jgi:hypothetical protein
MESNLDSTVSANAFPMSICHRFCSFCPGVKSGKKREIGREVRVISPYFDRYTYVEQEISALGAKHTILKKFV